MKYRRKPVVIDAVQWTGSNLEEINGLTFGSTVGSTDSDGLLIDTIDGRLPLSSGDWIIRGITGRLYSCKPDVFAATYEPEEAKT
jgi:hypothetical protein